MDNENQQLPTQELTEPPKPRVNTSSIYPEATHGINATAMPLPPAATPTPPSHNPAPATKTATSFLTHAKSRSLRWLIVGLVTVTATFFAGYQLAVYQTENNKTLLPHFGPSTCYSVTANAQPIPCSDLKPGILDKPVIYLYPAHQEQVNVKLSYPAGFITTSPSYDPQAGWQVTARPNGTLTNLADGKTYPYLFWEGKPAPLHFDMTKGFVVAGSQTRTFLQSQLTRMGLNQNETSGFIAFWLPRMQGNRYNLIHFAGSEYTNYAKLTVSPKPDSLLRVFMAFEPLGQPVPISTQTFPVFHRNGFTVVEWGGTELD